MFFASEEKKYSTPPLKVIWSVPYLNLISMMFGSFVGVLISYLCYLCLLANSSVKTHNIFMSNLAGVLQEAGTAYPS
jgi:hypothetical protein